MHVAENWGTYFGWLSIGLMGVLSIVNFLRGFNSKGEAKALSPEKVPTQETSNVETGEAHGSQLKAETPPAVSSVPKKSWQKKVFEGLKRTRSEIFDKVLENLSGNKASEEVWDNIEEVLYASDLGPKMVTELIDEMKEKLKGGAAGRTEALKVLSDFLVEKLSPIQERLNPELTQFSKGGQADKTRTILVIGVNGAGKTTTIGKLTSLLSSQGAKVLVGACDTFRAAAVEQLEAWAKKSDALFVGPHKPGADPSGVAYESLEHARKEKADYCIIDTAGRLHNKENLMEELKKTKRVLSKVDPDSPHDVVLVIDAVVGQNALAQAREFHKNLNLTSIIVTKCDSSSKAGSIVSITQDLGVPVSFVGVGEGVEDLNAFKVSDYVGGLLGIEATS